MRKLLILLASLFVFTSLFTGCVKIVDDEDDSSICISLPARGTRIWNSRTGLYYPASLDHCDVSVYHSNGKSYSYATTTEILYIDDLEDGHCSVRVQAVDRNGFVLDQVTKSYVRLEEDKTTYVSIRF